MHAKWPTMASNPHKDVGQQQSVSSMHVSAGSWQKKPAMAEHPPGEQ
jgi:hypothetical protein